MPLTRKQFLQGLLAAAGALACTPGHRTRRDKSTAEDHAGPRLLPRRKLGATGEVVTLLGVGGYHVGAADDEAAAREIVEAALEQGVRFFDNAESYQRGRAERWMGAALRGERERVFLMSKTHEPRERSAESAWRHLGGTLDRLGTDYLDLWQLHAISSPKDVDRAFATGGAMEAILDAKADGLVRYVGVTGHSDPAAHLRALEHWDAGLRFDCVQMPINPADHHRRSFQTAVLPKLVERGIGVIAMKTAAAGALLEQSICTLEECRRFAWSLPISVAVVGMRTPQEVRENAAFARAFETGGSLTPEELEQLLARVGPSVTPELEGYKAG